jgi:hypothetical protein
MLVCSSPQLIAAYHVLRRLSEPRHSPYALNCFKKIKINMTTDCDISAIDKIILGITTFSQYVKELKPVWKYAHANICKFYTSVVDVMVMNHQTYSISIVRHQYGKN